jgi:tetratricopeptide (TPR) repeat protein
MFQLDSELGTWLNDWSNGLCGGESADDSEQSDLRGILLHCTLSCAALSELALRFNGVSNDPTTAAVFCAEAVSRGDRELKAVAGFSDAELILTAMKNCETILWDARGESHLDSIYTLNRDLDQWIPAGDPSLGWAKVWAKVSMSECLNDWGRPAEALAVIQTADGLPIAADQRAAVAMAKADPLFELHRYADAAAVLRTEVDHPNADIRQAAAWDLLAESYAKLGRMSDANSAFDQWVRRGHPSIDAAASAFNRMGLTP